MELLFWGSKSRILGYRKGKKNLSYTKQVATYVRSCAILDQGTILPIHLVVEATCVTEVVTGAVTSPERSLDGTAVDTLPSLVHGRHLLLLHHHAVVDVVVAVTVHVMLRLWLIESSGKHLLLSIPIAGPDAADAAVADAVPQLGLVLQRDRRWSRWQMMLLAGEPIKGRESGPGVCVAAGTSVRGCRMTGAHLLRVFRILFREPKIGAHQDCLIMRYL